MRGRAVLASPGRVSHLRYFGQHGNTARPGQARDAHARLVRAYCQPMSRVVSGQGVQLQASAYTAPKSLGGNPHDETSQGAYRYL